MPPIIEKVLCDIEFGEAPHWDVANKCLYFVDVLATTINKYVPETKKHTKAKLDSYVSFIVPVDGEKNKFVLGCATNISLVLWDGESEKVEEIEKLCGIECPLPDIAEVRFNDAKCESSGRLWTGTVALNKSNGKVEPNMGFIYSFFDRTLKAHFDNITISNGLTWSKDEKIFFYIDSAKKTIDRFDYDVNTGEIKNRTVLFSFEKNGVKGFPDGMTIDDDDHLWIASYEAQTVIKIDSKVPDTLLETIIIPNTQVTSVAWGGQNLDELYVTAGKHFVVLEGELNPSYIGGLYKISGLGTKGRVMTNFKL